MKALKVLSLCLLLITTGACQKDVVTEGEKMAQSVQAVVNEKNVRLANVIVGTVQQQYGAVFAIEGQFLTIADSYGYKQYYNLSKLIKFNTGRNVADGPLVLVFYF
ncbi:hypothetical protein [Spirosoma rhododendri]|uniref:DUF4359 domain-containing protein n=1 Tax=Spirosoma rhododendri TaxID=2728024 RepID=A0A7L5DWB9_9BACT|nr:hypothetical protein [Spirosoma rhododendri]QJD81643.1 hypothetical protein HH216_25200 [Spirosoma rhododendri]